MLAEAGQKKVGKSGGQIERMGGGFSVVHPSQMLVPCNLDVFELVEHTS